eukprot:7960247-Pyramimonas_sp.AAC.1
MIIDKEDTLPAPPAPRGHGFIPLFSNSVGVALERTMGDSRCPYAPFIGARNKRNAAAAHGTNLGGLGANSLMEEKRTPMPLGLQVCAKGADFILDASHSP